MLKEARDFVYSKGTLWERALFAHLFEDGPIERVHQTLVCYRNDDGGWGHALEHDIRTPDSHPLALEYILGVFVRDMDLPVGNLFDDAAGWLEQNTQEDGSLKNPESVLDYPHAPWWNLGGQSMPDSITGNLIKIGKASPALLESTRRWVEANVTPESIRENEWLFMAYHAYDYFMNIDEFPLLEDYRQATIDNIIECTTKAPEKQYYEYFMFAPTPDSPVAQATPEKIIKRNIQYLWKAQQDDGGWNDEHGLPQWRPMVTMSVMAMFRRYGLTLE